MAATVTRLPLDVGSDTREVDALTARALRLALGAERSTGEASVELFAAARGNVRVLDAAIARIDRALACEWSRTGARALIELQAARHRADAESGRVSKGVIRHDHHQPRRGERRPR